MIHGFVRGGALIRAAPETVWKVITDAGCYAQRDPGVGRGDRRHPHGKIVRIRTGGLARSVPVAVHRYGDNAMSWTFRLPGGLGKGVRTINVSAENGKTGWRTDQVPARPGWGPPCPLRLTGVYAMPRGVLPVWRRS